MPKLPLPRTKFYGVLYGDKYVLHYTKGRGDDFFSIGTGTSERKVVEKFPLTEAGWAQAFKAFAELEPRRAERELSRVRGDMQAEEWRQRAASGLAVMRQSLFLGGHGLALNPAQAYDLLFDQEGLVVVKDYVTAVRILMTR